MFDKQKIIRMTTELENFVRTFPNIYILPETFSANVLSLLKRLNVNVVAIIANAPNPQPNVIRMPSGEYKLADLQTLLQNFNEKTGIIISSFKQIDNPIFAMKFNVEKLIIELPAFALTDEEALAIYDRLTTIQVMKQYQSDGIITNIKDMPIRFARGISTFIDSQFQDVKVQVWDRREFKIPSYDEVDDAAIVMQGPLEYKDSYTITTARLYRQWYPNAPIVISTWKNEATENFSEECRKINVVLLENDLPDEPGSSNINYQLESSFKGVEYVKNNTSTKFALKCRTDQRINRTDFLPYFKNLLRTFSVKDSKINSRIILLGWSKWWPFFLNDFLYFGDIEDMNKLIGIPKQTKDEKEYLFQKKWHGLHKIAITNRFKPDLKIKESKKLHNFNIMMNCFRHSEIFILTSFYKKYIGSIDPSKLLQTYWKFLRDYLIIVDEQNILLDWPKYYGHGVFNGAYNAKSYYDRGLDFSRWLDIYLNYKDEDEL